MLTLGRRPGESLVIADVVVINIVSIENNYVKIGIEAPREIGVDRYEIWKAKRESAGEPTNIEGSKYIGAPPQPKRRRNG